MGKNPGMSASVSENPTADRAVQRYQPLLPVLAAVCLGIFADRHVSPALAAWWAVAASAWAGWLACRWLRSDRAACVLLLVAASAAAGAWHHLRWSRFAADDIGCFAEAVARPVCVEAVVETGARRAPARAYDPMQIIPSGDRTTLDVRAERIRDGATWRPISGRASLAIDGRSDDLRPGDRIRVLAQLAAPRAARNPGEFSRADYLRGNRLRAMLRAEGPRCVTVLARAGPWQPRRWLEWVQRRANDGLWRRLDPRYAGLASGLLLGNREQLEGDQTTAFQTTGMAHLLAVSGMNVAIVVLSLAWVLRAFRVSTLLSAVLLAAAAIGYALLTNAEAPVVRASILVVVFAIAVALGRSTVRFNSLAAAAIIVLILNPVDLFRAGPQLSFLSVAALMWFAPEWFGTTQRSQLDALIEENELWLTRARRATVRSIRHVTLVSLAIWLIILPLVMAKFHLLSPAAILLNTLLWIPVTLAVCGGFVVLTVGWLLPPLGAVAAWVCNGSLAMIDGATKLAQDFPGSHFWVPGPPDWWLWGLYGGMLAAAVAGRWRPPRRWLVALAAGWIGVGMLAASWPRQADRLECTFLSVGHGLAVLVELPGGGTLLYDAGSFAPPDATAQVVAGCLWEKGITRLDAIVLSHPDADHYNALPGILRRVPVGAVYVPPTMFAKENRPLAALREAITAAGVPLEEMAAGDRLTGRGPWRIEALHPVHGTRVTDNAGSLVLLVEHAGRRILLTGDLEPPGLGDVLAEEPIDCDVLLVPHHGSRSSSPPGLVAWSRPRRAVISGSLARDPGLTEAAYRECGVEVVHTARVGAVEVAVEGTGKLGIWGFRD